MTVRELITQLDAWAATYGDNAEMAVRTLEHQPDIDELDSDSVLVFEGLGRDDSHKVRRCVLATECQLVRLLDVEAIAKMQKNARRALKHGAGREAGE